jgi:hypothetical protein
MDQYKNLSKQFKKERRSEIFNKIKTKVNPYPRLKYKYLTKTNKAPDVSTITEHIAFVIDGQVVEIIHCQPKMAAILLSEPEIVKIPDGSFAKPGWVYDSGEFKEPTIDRQISVPRDSEAIELGLPTFKEYQQQMKMDSLPTFKEYIEKLKERV